MWEEEQLWEVEMYLRKFNTPINHTQTVNYWFSVKEHKTRLTSRRYIIQNLEHIYSNTS